MVLVQPYRPQKNVSPYSRYAMDTKEESNPECPGLWVSAECNFPLFGPIAIPFNIIKRLFFFLMKHEN